MAIWCICFISVLISLLGIFLYASNFSSHSRSPSFHMMLFVVELTLELWFESLS